MRDELLGFYEQELVFLRRMGAEFARKYPKIAGRLELDEEKVEDPHVERMIESFAFLAGRIGLKLSDELPEITESLLNLIYPHYLAPIPSMAISQFGFGSPNDKLTSVQTLPRGTGPAQARRSPGPIPRARAAARRHRVGGRSPRGFRPSAASTSRRGCC